MDLQCIAPDEIEDTDLLAYLAGVALPAAKRHIERCAHCRQETQALLAMDSLLQDAWRHANCPDPDFLWRYANKMPLGDETAVAHIIDCLHCQGELRQLNRAQYTAPVESTDRQPAFPLRRLQRTGKRLLTAVLLSTPSSPALALRGDPATRHTYKAGDYEILLVKTPPIGREKIWQVEGQIISQIDLTMQFEGDFTMHKEDALVLELPIDELGYFDLGRLTPGRYTLTLEMQEEIVLVQDFVIP